MKREIWSIQKIRGVRYDWGGRTKSRKGSKCLRRQREKESSFASHDYMEIVLAFRGGITGWACSFYPQFFTWRTKVLGPPHLMRLPRPPRFFADFCGKHFFLKFYNFKA